MRTTLPPDPLRDLDLADLELADVTFGSKNWDRRRSNQVKQQAEIFLERAALHLIEDQMAADRVYWPGAVEAVRLLHRTVVAIKSEVALEERSARVAASWLPKYTLERLARRGDSDA